jgi:hypothetical protein
VSSGDELDNPVKLLTYRFELYAERILSRNLTLNGSASYWNQDSQGDVEVQSTAQIWRVTVGITWKFDPIPL